MASQGEDQDFIPECKKQRLQRTTSQKCIICQECRNELLRKGKAIDTFIRAVKRRKDEVYNRLSADLDNLTNQDVFWHSTCYASYTSEQNIRYATEDRGIDGLTERRETVTTTRTSRSSVLSIDWSKCLFCRKKTNKKVATMYNVRTFEACQRIRNAAEVKGDEQLLHCLRSVKFDLMAAEAKYHKDCLSSYVSKSNLKHQRFGDSDSTQSAYEVAFKELVQQIGPSILEESRAYDMSSILMMYRNILTENGANMGESYTKHRLKERLKRYFGNDIEFLQQANKKSEIVYSSALSIHDLINNAGASSTSENSNESSYQEIMSAASMIREEIKKCEGIELHPLNVQDISLETAKRIVPSGLYLLMRQIICPSDTDETSCLRKEDERKVLTISQDIIHASSSARVKLPKHIGLAIAVHHRTGSKILNTLLNRMGHCSSYSEVQAVDTSLAMEVTARVEQFGSIIPSNISPGPFVQLGADNNDINEETLDGKNTTHATTMVVYQRRQFGPDLPPTVRADHTKRRRSLESVTNLYDIQECNMHGRRPSVNCYNKAIKSEWFSSSDKSAFVSERDACWALLRIDPSEVLNPTNVAEPTRQLVPGWSGFNAILYPEVPCFTNIGYCPLLDAPATEFSTIYTVLKHAQQISSSLGQSETVITFDLAIYIKAKQIQMKYPDEFVNTVIRLGGFHIALNFLSVIGKKYQSSGLDDLLIESGVYAAGTTSALMAGKCYNRGVRAHKLCFEVFFRLMWKAFLVWSKDREQNEEAVLDEKLKKELEECRNVVDSKDYANIFHKFECLQKDLEEILVHFKQFKKERAASSKLFSFWMEYSSMVNLLLNFIHAERTGNWELHLSTVAAMTPYFFAMDRQNYARWLPVYIADMHQIKSKHPNVHNEFMQGNHVVSRSSNPFCQVSTDMALEQSINADSKTKGGIIGISKRPAALQRWFLTSHERAAITSAVEMMYGVEKEDRVGAVHKESSANRISRDENDIQKMTSCFTSSLMANPFVSDRQGELANFATGVVLPLDIADKLLDSTKKGKEQMEAFIKERLDTNKVSFWDPIPNLKIKSFNTTSKTTNVKANDRVITVSADRELFGRLLIAANTREINLREVLSYELSAVPFSLAHQDGSLRKNTKSILSKILEDQVEVLPRLPPSTAETVYVMDGMALIQMVKSASASTFGELSSKYYTIITTPLQHTNCNEVHLVFDQYLATSIKGGERSRRGASSSLEVNIHGTSTPVPKQWSKYISNPQNKINLCDFLTKALCNQGKRKLMDGKTLIIGGGYKDGEIAVSIKNGSSEFMDALKCTHEEADTRLLLHVKHASASRVVLQSPDTDVLVLCTYHFRFLECEELWFRTGVQDRLRFIPVHLLSQRLGPRLSNCLLALHALTGCDTTSSLAGISKKKAWDNVVKSVEHQDNLGLVGESAVLDDSTAAKCETFVCSLYSVKKKVSSADELRYVLFCQKRQKSELLPPTTNSLHQHVKRVQYQTFIWRNALVARPPLPPPDGNGWEMISDTLQPCYMTRAPAPRSLLELTTCQCKKSECKTNCSCASVSLSCTEACACMANEDSCSNPHGIYIEDDDESEDEYDSDND